MSKEITDFEEQLSNLSDHELLAVIAALTKWKNRFENNLKLAKKEYERYNDPGSREDLRFNNKTVGNISVTKGSEGYYVVKDPKAYAAVLKQIQWTLDDGRDAWYTTIMPCPEACTAEFLEDLVFSHEGEMPKGVEYKNGTTSTVKVVLSQHYASSDLDIKEILKTNILQIEEGKK